MKTTITVSSEIVSSARVLQVGGMFDVPASKRSELSWAVDMPFETKPWNVGLIVGPSGCGKSTIARKAFPEQLAHAMTWPADRSILDAFPAALGVKDVVELLSSVGFSSPPSWMRPFHVLSNGEQFRVGLARLLAELPELAVVDEFTSVVDRTVAQLGSTALAKTVRRRGGKFVAVACHEDIEEWLQPDWVFRPAELRFAWRSLQRRPPIDLEINRVHYSAWKLFAPHHYLTADLHRAAACFVAFWRGRPVAFSSWLPFVGRLKDARKGRRGHRTVVLPDYQGVGIGRTIEEWGAGLFTGLGFRVFDTSAHPALVKQRMRSPLWKTTRGYSHSSADGHGGKLRHKIGHSSARLTASFEYTGPAMTPARAKEALETWAVMR